MLLIRFTFFILFAIIATLFPAFSHAEETLALNTPSTNGIAPEWLPSARDIRIELIPEIPASESSASTIPLTSTAPPAFSSNEQAAPAQRDLWGRIRSGFAMPDINSKLVSKHEKWYADRPDYVARMTERARRYLFYIMEEVERRGMPTEIALLPMIESAFNPGANSIASASGIWQFMPATGRHFGMEQNWWHDGRRDIIGATNGALDYLQKLHDQFHDWDLALAAYNLGENGIVRAQAYNRRLHKPTDYAHLSRIPRETRNYVPKLMAIKNIVGDPARFGLTLNGIPDEPYFEAIATPQHMDVKVAAELADISMDEFMALNPGHNRPVILQDTSNVLLLPVDKVETFRSNLEKTHERLVSWQPYESKKGERFDQIADRFSLTVDELRSANGFSKFSQISNGQTLLVPILNEEPAVEFTAFNMHPSAAAEMLGAVRYTVRRGDTISTIAHRFNVSQAQLRESNHGRTFLRVGQHFNIVLSDHRPNRKHRTAAVKVKKFTAHKATGMNVSL